MKQKRGETLSSLLLLTERGWFSHLPGTFSSHCDLSRSCPRTSIANEFMKPFTERSTTTCLSHLDAGTWGLITGACWVLALTLTMNGSPAERPGMFRLAPIHIQALLAATYPGRVGFSNPRPGNIKTCLNVCSSQQLKHSAAQKNLGKHTLKLDSKF